MTVLAEVTVRHQDHGDRSLPKPPHHQVLRRSILEPRVEDVVDERRSPVRREQEQPRIRKRGDVAVGRGLPTDQIHGETHETRFLDGEVEADPGTLHPLDGVVLVVPPLLEGVHAGETDEEQREGSAGTERASTRKARDTARASGAENAP